MSEGCNGDCGCGKNIGGIYNEPNQDEEFSKVVAEFIKNLACFESDSPSVDMGVLPDESMWCDNEPRGDINITILKNRSPEPKATYPDDVKFTFYGCTGNCNNHDGVLVIASCVDDEQRVCYYGTAWCSPKDVYQKEVGKKIAYEDMVRNLRTVPLVKKRHHEINARIMSDIIANDDAPSWAKNKVALDLCNHLVNAFDIEEW